MPKLSEEQIIEQANKNISFKRHFFIYFLINLLLAGLDFYDNGRFNWFYFTTLGWGIGVLSHYISIIPNSIFSVDKEIERIRKNNG